MLNSIALNPNAANFHFNSVFAPKKIGVVSRRCCIEVQQYTGIQADVPEKDICHLDALVAKVLTEGSECTYNSHVASGLDRVFEFLGIDCAALVHLEAKHGQTQQERHLNMPCKMYAPTEAQTSVPAPASPETRARYASRYFQSMC